MSMANIIYSMVFIHFSSFLFSGQMLISHQCLLKTILSSVSFHTFLITFIGRVMQTYVNKKWIIRVFSIVIMFITICLVSTMALLIWDLLVPNSFFNTNHMNLTCPPVSCSPATSILNESLTSTSVLTTVSSSNGITSTTLSMSSETVKTKKAYQEPCENLFDCDTIRGLLCQFEWKGNQMCLCEGSHYWSYAENKCLQKGRANDRCNNDYECHREIGLICDQPSEAVQKRCICAADLYWSKDSNCGETKMLRIVECTEEYHATTCLVMASNHLYHTLTVRSLTEKELSFDWFLIDNRDLSDLPNLNCAYNNETKYCFGLSLTDEQHSLKLAQFTKKGFQSIENMGNINKGMAFGLADIDRVMVFVRNSQNTLYRQMIIDDEILPIDEIASSVSGDPTCYIDGRSKTRETYCFIRNDAERLSEYVETTTNVWRVTRLGSSEDLIRDETAPMCTYVGKIYRYCFAILKNGHLSRIVFNEGTWSSWKTMGSQEFLTTPILLTTNLLDSTDMNESCYLIGIDKSEHLQLSKNMNCSQTDSFTDWIPLFETFRFKQFDKIFRLRDGNLGILGIDSDNHPCYTYFDLKTQQFTEPQIAITIKPNEFHP